MELTKDALGLLLETAQQAAEFKLVENHDPRKVVVLHRSAIHAVDVPPPLRRSVVNSLETLIQVAQGEAAEKPVVWHADEFVILVLDDADRRDTVAFPLKHSRQFARLLELDEGAHCMDQRCFVRMLRQTLGVSADLVGPFRRIDWSVHKMAGGQVEHGIDRLGRDIQAQVGQATPLPEEMVLSVPIYDQLGERDQYRSIRCDVEIDVIGERLALVPLAGEIPYAIDAAQEWIHQRLVEDLGDEVPVYYGRP